MNKQFYKHIFYRCTLSKKGFTLLELIIVIVIIGITATMGVVIFSKVPETTKGKSCATNMRAILGAWRIYNMSKGNAYVTGGGDDGFKEIGTINTKLNTEIIEKYFGDDSTDKYGFYMYAYTYVAPPYLRIKAYRVNGSVTGNITCDYHYTGANAGYTWYGTWPYPVE